jgi:hypothetical protein
MDFFLSNSETPEDLAADQKKHRIEFIINIIYLFVTAALLGFMLYVTLKVYKIVKCNDKIIMSMLLFLNL